MTSPVEAPPHLEEPVEEPQNKVIPEEEDEKEPSDDGDINSFLG